MLKRESIFLLFLILFLQSSVALRCHAQTGPATPAQQKAQDEENKKRLQDLQDEFQSSLLVEEPIPPNTATFLSPQHDLRMAIDFGFLRSEIAKFYAIGYGDTIDLNSLKCGYSHFLVSINEVPLLSAKWVLNYSGSFGANVIFSPQAIAQSGPCFFNDHPSVGAGADLKASLTNVSNIDSIPVAGTAYIKGIAVLWPFMIYPFRFDIPFEGKPLSRIPIKLTDSASTELDYGNFQNNSWVSSGKEKDLPLIVNAGGVSKMVPQGDFLVADAAIGSTFPTKPFPTSQQAQSDFGSDLPLWDPTQRVGLSVGRSFFGVATPNKPGSGLFGFLLPIRVQGTVDRQILFFHIKKKYEVFLDGATAMFEPHEGSTGVRANLSSSRWTISDKALRRTPSQSGPIKDVTASILFDRFMLGDQVLKFRVADFRLKIRTKWFVFPITLSSGQLEDSLNGGTVPLAGFKNRFSIDLPSCVKPNSDILWAAAGKCTDICPQRKGCMSFTQGVQSLVFVLDPTIQVQSQGEFLHLALRLNATQAQTASDISRK
jgi:hypothetical protein